MLTSLRKSASTSSVPRKARRVRSAQWRRQPAAGVTCTVLHRSNDDPWEEIIKVAKERGCDLIFMASHGRRGVGALLLGSETNKVLTHSTIPVLVTVGKGACLRTSA